MTQRTRYLRSLVCMSLGLTLIVSGLAAAEEPRTKDKPAAKLAKADVAKKKGDSAGKQEDVDAQQKPKITVAEIEVGGVFSEGPSQQNLFGDDNSTMMRLTKRLHQAKDDNKVRSVLLRLKGVALGRGQLNELRQAIDAVRDNGKMVYASMEMGATTDYLVACACDKIMMPESGLLLLPGIRAEVTFYKGLLDKLDVEADMLQVGDFKGAAEPMTRTQMSEAFRKQLDVVLSDYYDQMVETISADRSLAKDRVRELIDQGVLTAEVAKAAGLIDIVDYDEAWEQQLLVGSKDHKLAVVEDYGKKKVDTDFSGMGGFIKLMEMLSGGRKSTSRAKQADKIALVYAVGAITSGKSSSSPFGGGQTMGSDTIVEALTTADEDDKVVAIILRVDSPGGSALASDMIWNKIRKIKKPVIASMGNVAASGGYYISMGCDKIFAEPGTLTGSIGVVGGKVVTGGLMKKIGISTDIIAYGKNSGMFSTTEPFSDAGRDTLRKYMDETYKQFTEKAAAGRDMDVDKLLQLAGGRVWTGRQAKKNGLIDEVGTLDDAIRAAQKMARVKTDAEPNLFILPEQKTFFEEVFGASAQAPSAATWLPAPLRAHWFEVETLERIFREPAAFVMPCRIEIK